MPLRSAQWRTRTASLAISAIAHVVLLAAMLATLSVRTPPQPAPLVVRLVPLLEPSPARHPRAAKPPPAVAPSSSATSPPPAASAHPPAGIAAPPRPGPGAMDDLGKARAVIRGALGCAHPELARLTDAERAACAKRLASGVNPNVAWPANIAPEKRAWFDASVASHNSPDRPPVFGCALGRGPPHALKLGPLPCFIAPPKGSLDDDVDVPPPSKNGPSYEGTPLKPQPPVPDFTGGGGPSY